ncbi:response regulator transcription factor [soil metagenome]
MNQPRPITVIIADDHPVYRFGLRAVLAAEPTVRLLGEAESGTEALELAKALTPDVMLMDINMPGLNGIEATRSILATQPAIAILVLTMLEDDDSVLTAMRAGARGYLVKGAGSDEVLRAVSAVASGEAIFGSAIAARMLSRFTAERSEGTRNQPSDLFPGLTQRELEVLTLLAEGLTNATIADRLFLSGKTVRNHVSSIFGKLQVSDRGQAIIRARDAGLPRL